MIPLSWKEDSVAWKGLWCWRMIWDIKSAFFDGSIVGSMGLGSVSKCHICGGGGSRCSESENEEKE